jgi:hypothetical protein
MNDMYDLWETTKTPNLWNMGRGEGKEVWNKAIENMSNKIIAENFPNHEKEMTIHTQEAFMTPNS